MVHKKKFGYNPLGKTTKSHDDEYKKPEPPTFEQETNPFKSLGSNHKFLSGLPKDKFEKRRRELTQKD